jgi:hypothetical protein
MKLFICVLILSSISLFGDAATCAKQFGAFTNTNGCSCGTATCDASTGFHCVTSLNLCATESVPPGVTFSGSSVVPTLMGKWTWTGSTLNSKPTYKFANGDYYLYWIAGGNNVWCIGASAGSTEVIVHWTNNVARPELAANPTLVGASFAADSIVISKTCAVPNGMYSNENKCSCGSAICNDGTGFFCQALKNECSNVVVCTSNDGSTANDHACACGSNECDNDKGTFCLASANECSNEKIEVCTSNVGLSINSKDCWCGTNECNSSTGRYCVSSINLCTSDFVPGDVTLSGSTLHPSFMGKYTWLGSNFNGKPKYKFGLDFLYWETKNRVWFIGPLLGGASGVIYWTNNVLRPEFSPSPTAIKAADSSGAWKDDTITITSSKVCLVKDGSTANNNDCTCGISDCDADTGLSCLASSSKCSKNEACIKKDGQFANDVGCICGRSICDNGSGFFCHAPSNRCAKKVIACSKKDGSSVNANKCSCGSHYCDSVGMYCVSSLNVCTTNFVPGDVTLSGSTLQSAIMGKYLWQGTTLTNGKPAYKFSNYYLYWESTNNIWVIGPSLGEPSGALYWSNDVLRPEFSPTPAIAIKAGNGNGGWIDETMVIVSSKACAAANGASINDRECTCGTSDCVAATGMYCLASSSKCATVAKCSNIGGSTINDYKCMCSENICDSTVGLFCQSSLSKCSKVVVCSNNDGSFINKNDCACGTSECDSATGLFCYGSLNKCGTLAPCNKKDGVSANEIDCTCGTNDCTKSSGMFCDSSLGTCTISNFVPGDVTLSGSTVDASLMGKYTWLGKNFNGKPLYEFKTTFLAFLYWHSKLERWQVSSTPGADASVIHWKNNVARPELSNPTTVKSTWKKDNGWKKDYFIITSSKDCTNKDGRKTNNKKCTCGSTDCNSIGMYCRSKSNKCGSSYISHLKDALPDGNQAEFSATTPRALNSLGRVCDDWIAGGTKRSVVEAQYGLIENWDVSQVTDMDHLFHDAKTFDADLSRWNIKQVTTMVQSKSVLCFSFFPFFFFLLVVILLHFVSIFLFVIFSVCICRCI